jgi:hypothetical protein
MILAGTTVAAVVVAVVGMIWWSQRPDPSPFLPNSGATLARVPEPKQAPYEERFVLDESLVRPGFEPGGFVLRQQGTGPWWFDRVDSSTTPGGVGYVTAATECADALIAAGATGAQSTAMELVDPAPVSRATVWRNADGTEWKQMVLDDAPPSSIITGVVSGRIIGKPDQLVGSARTLTKTSDAFVVASDDCGRSWQRVDLPGGTGRRFDYAAAVTASSDGYAIAGSIEGPGQKQSIAVWRSPDGLTWTLSSRPEEAVASYAPKSISVDGSEIMIASQSDNRIYVWDGKPDSWFSVQMVARRDAEILGSFSSTVGILTMQVGDVDRKIDLGTSRDGDTRVDRVPRVRAKKYSVMTFLGSGGSRAWVVGQRDGTGKLETWSLTLPNTASEP